MMMWCLFLCFSIVASDGGVWPVENRILQLKTAAPRSDSPPSYMVHLYNRYRKGRMPYSSANTVRSFFPTPGKLGPDDILVFNLTGVHPSEYVERVDFHLRSKAVRPSRRPDLKKSLTEVDILDLSRPLRPKVETLSLSRVQAGGWQTLDITDSIIACLEGILLVFNLTCVHPSEYVERMDFHLRSKAGRPNPRRPDPRKQSLTEVDVLDLSRKLRPKVETLSLSRVQAGGWQTMDITDSIIACLEGEAEQHHLVGISIRSPGDTDASDVVSQPFIVLFSEDDDHLDIEELGREVNRQKREILTNELPDYSSKAGSELREARLKYKPLDSAVEIPQPEARRGEGEEEHKKRRRRRRRKDKRLPYAWGKSWWKKSDLKNNPDYEGDDDEDYDELDDEGDDRLVCQKRKMVVSFAEIGWGEWIISPKTFDASYCAGVCPHPLKKNVQSTNHGVIQSIVQSLGLKKGVPELCCVPHTLAPLSLLYYDHNRNIVLKSYPDMSVQNCSCR